ncbi:MAG: histidinol-phosphate transaminase [Chromatiales bacterium]|nr:MAG: histidinol-phosphate transaminase [Chromatiales bacterium]
MTSTLDLLRPEIRHLRPYQPADYVGGFIRLNANETPWRPPGDETRDGLNRYPDPRPTELTKRLAALYGVPPDQLLVTRGSSEGIDVLIRAFCRAGEDKIVICPPTFGMYEAYAQLQGAGVRAVPLDRANGYSLPADRILEQWSPADKLVFVCSPNNPTGNLVPDAAVDRLCVNLAGRGVVVLDAAYQEFAGADPLRDLLSRHENLVILRTLSKALSLAGVRCGAMVGRSPLIGLLGRVLPPYCFPTTSQDAVLRLLTVEAQGELAARRARIVAERGRLSTALAVLPGVARVWPSAANFILIESEDAGALVARARAAGILLRDFSWDPLLPGCVRITVGSPEENDKLLEALNT